MINFKFRDHQNPFRVSVEGFFSPDYQQQMYACKAVKCRYLPKGKRLL